MRNGQNWGGTGEHGTALTDAGALAAWLDGVSLIAWGAPGGGWGQGPVGGGQGAHAPS